MDRYRLAVAGLTHGHVWGLLDQFEKHGGYQFVAVADETPLLEKAGPRFERPYRNWREMLDTEQIDAVVVTSDNRTGAEIARETIKRHIHTLVEKPMAADAEGAETLYNAWKESGATLMINWPTNWQPALRSLLNRAKRGDFGQIFGFRFRTGHGGPKEIGCDEFFVGWLYDERLNGGGASADFGGYGAKMSAYLLGMPDRVVAFRGNFTKEYDVCDDNAAFLLGYPKATAVLEATWSQQGSDGAGNPIVYGTEATATVIDGKLRIDRKWSGATFEDPDPLPEGERNPAEYFYGLLQHGRAAEGMVSPEIGLMAQRIVSMGLASNSR